MKALVICSGSVEYAKAALDLVKEQFGPEKIHVVAQREAYERGLKDLKPPYEVLLLTSPSSLFAAIKSLRKETIDLRVSLFTGEYGHGRLKFLSFLFRAKRKFIFTKNYELYELTFQNWRIFFRYLRQEIPNMLKSLALAFVQVSAKILRLIVFPLVFLYLLLTHAFWSAERRIRLRA